MIIDRLQNHRLYPFGWAWQKAFEFLDTLTPDSEDRKYVIAGEDIFAIVMSYKTCAPETALFESHRNYVGSEVFECYFKDDLTVKTPYDLSKDIEFYKRTAPGVTRVTVTPQTFVMLYPHDAHMPGLMVDKKPELIKKVVVKIKKELLTGHP